MGEGAAAGSGDGVSPARGVVIGWAREVLGWGGRVRAVGRHRVAVGWARDVLGRRGRVVRVGCDRVAVCCGGKVMAWGRKVLIRSGMVVGWGWLG